jgi:hypothetical protein
MDVGGFEPIGARRKDEGLDRHDRPNQRYKARPDGRAFQLLASEDDNVARVDFKHRRQVHFFEASTF